MGGNGSKSKKGGGGGANTNANKMENPTKSLFDKAPVGSVFVSDRGGRYTKETAFAYSVKTATGRTLSGGSPKSIAERLSKRGIKVRKVR